MQTEKELHSGTGMNVLEQKREILGKCSEMSFVVPENFQGNASTIHEATFPLPENSRIHQFCYPRNFPFLPKDSFSICMFVFFILLAFFLLLAVYLVHRINLLLIDIFLCLVLLDDTLFLNFIQAHMKFIFCAVDNVRMRGLNPSPRHRQAHFYVPFHFSQFTATNYFTSLPKRPHTAISIIHLPSLEHIDVCNLNFPSSIWRIFHIFLRAPSAITINPPLIIRSRFKREQNTKLCTSANLPLKRLSLQTIKCSINTVGLGYFHFHHSPSINTKILLFLKINFI